jgi:hypothetical protein
VLTIVARDGWRCRVFHLEPLVRAASTVRRAKPLADDALAAERASVLVDQRAVAVVGGRRDARLVFEPPTVTANLRFFFPEVVGKKYSAISEAAL